MKSNLRGWEFISDPDTEWTYFKKTLPLRSFVLTPSSLSLYTFLFSVISHVTTRLLVTPVSDQ